MATSNGIFVTDLTKEQWNSAINNINFDQKRKYDVLDQSLKYTEDSIERLYKSIDSLNDKREQAHILCNMISDLLSFYEKSLALNQNVTRTTVPNEYKQEVEKVVPNR